MRRRLATEGGIRGLIFEDMRQLIPDLVDVDAYADPASEKELRAAAALAVLVASNMVATDVAGLLDEAAGVARLTGCTWEQIGRALGISRQAATKRFAGSSKEV